MKLGYISPSSPKSGQDAVQDGLGVNAEGNVLSCSQCLLYSFLSIATVRLLTVQNLALSSATRSLRFHRRVTLGDVGQPR